MNATDREILIVVPTLGTRLEYLELALGSIASQIPSDCVVVGPSAADGAAALASKYGARYLPFDESGLSKAINHGWREGGCEATRFCAWLGDDDALAPGSLDAARRALEGDPRATAVYGRCRVTWHDGSTQFVSKPGRFAGFWLAHGSDRVPQPGSLFRMDAVQAVGALDESLRYAMDYSLFLALAKLGPLIYIPVELGLYRQHAEAISYNKGDGGAEAVAVRRAASRRGEPGRAASAVVRVVDRLYSTFLRHTPWGPPPVDANGTPYSGVTETGRGGLRAIAPLRLREP